MGLTGFQGDVVTALNDQDMRNQDLLDQVVSAAAAVSDNKAIADVTIKDVEDQVKLIDANIGKVDSNDLDKDGNKSETTSAKDKTDYANANGSIHWGGKTASLQGTGGVALLEYAKDAIQTAVSNISGMGTNQITARKLVERKMGNLG